MVDALLPLLAKGSVPIRSAYFLGLLHKLFKLVPPIAIRPSVLIIRSMFEVASPDVQLYTQPDARQLSTDAAVVRTDAQPLPADDEPGPQKYHWLPVVLVLLKTIVSGDMTEATLLQGVNDACANHSCTMPPEDVLLHFLLDVLGRSTERLIQHKDPVTDFMCQQFAQLLHLIKELLNACDGVSFAFGPCA